MHSYHISNFLAGIVVAQQKKKDSFTYINASDFIVQNASILTRLGFLYSYTVHFDNPDIPTSRSVTVFLKYYRMQPLITSIKLFSMPSRTYFIGLKKLVGLVKQQTNAIYIIQTSEGLIDGVSCLTTRKAGILLYKIN